MNIENPMVINAEIPDPPIHTWCGWCEEPIYVGDEYYETPDETCYCGTCMGSFKKEAREKE